MKTSLWSVIALVTGIVGFLLGYSVSAYTGSRSQVARAGHGGAAPTETAARTVPAAKTEAGGYGAAPEKPAPAAAAAGEKKTAAAGY